MLQQLSLTLLLLEELTRQLRVYKNVYSVNEGTAPIYQRTVNKYKAPISAARNLKTYAKEVGIASSVSLGIDIGFDIHDYVGWDIGTAIGIDVGTLLVGVLVGAAVLALAPESIATAVGVYAINVGFSMISNSIKDAYLKRRS